MKPDLRLIEDITSTSNDLFGGHETAIRQYQVDLISEGCVLIAQERIRQIVEKGYDTNHDDLHNKGEIAQAASFYAMKPCVRADFTYRSLGPDAGKLNFGTLWPFDGGWVGANKFEYDRQNRTGYCDLDKRIHELAAAGALAAAEIDRLLRIKNGATYYLETNVDP